MPRNLALGSLLTGSILFAVGAIFYFALPVLLPQLEVQFQNEALYRPWPGWTSTYMFLHPFGYGVAFAVFYRILRVRGALRPGRRDGAAYGLVVFLLGALPIYLLEFASFQMSPEMIVSWLAQSACQYLAAGVALGWYFR